MQKFTEKLGAAFEKTDILLLFQDQDLLNFLQLLVVTLKKADAGEKFLKLYGQYKLLLSKKGLVAPVEYLGREYFGLNLGSPPRWKQHVG